MAKTKCHRCSYEWDYNGQGYYATCPRCRTTIKVRDVEPKEVKE